MIALNIGSGQRPFRHPWVNTDIQDKWKKLTEESGCKWAEHDWIQAAATGCCSIICLHHVIEHFGCNEADLLIENCYRLLKPGGSLLVFVPDMRALAGGWLMHKIDTQIYMTNVYGAYMSDEADRHKWGYDYASLRKYLTHKWSWSTVKRFDFRPIEGADIAKDWWILGMECVR